MYTAYNLILNLALIISFPYLLLRAALGKYGIAERMGRLSKEGTEKLRGQESIWFHAASVGEVKVLSTIIPEVKRSHPQYALVVSTMTKTGKKEAQRILSGVEMVFFLPVDLKRFIRRALKSIKPAALVLVETELWPNLVRETKKRGSFVALINGRISRGSLSRYLLVRSLFEQTLSNVDLLCMQSEEHKERMMLLGANPDKIKVTGNLKFDRLLLAGQAKDPAGLREKMHVPDHCTVVIGGSTREGEEQILVEVFKRLKPEYRNLIFILAPRHLDRLKQVEKILSASQMGFVRRTQLDKRLPGVQTEEEPPWRDQSVILLDTMGELSKIYSLADAAFVGGSLVRVGGHNLLEPAIYGVPVLFGPYVDHFKEEATILIRSGGGIQVKDEEELYSSLSSLLADDEKRTKMGENAREAIQKRTGVAGRTTDLIFSSLEKCGRPSAVGCRPTTIRPRLSADGGLGRSEVQGRRTLHTPARWFLSFLSLPYRLACLTRLLLYRHGVCKQKKLEARVISVGNVTVGGTGKTPLVLYLAEKLQEKSKKVAILTRGYKRKKKEMVELTQETKGEINWEDVGDEPYLLAQRLLDLPIIVTKHRNRSGDYAIEKHGAEFLILDDGFQHLKLFRNLNIVVIDSVNPFGNGRLLPAGILREPMTSLKRADVFLLTKTDQASNKGALIRILKGYSPKAPIVESVYKIRSIVNLFDGSLVEPKEVKDTKAVAFSGIGNPSSFENSLSQLKIRILKHRRFSDHFPYRKKNVLDLKKEARVLGADFIITTEKDSVRIPLINDSEIPFYVLKIDLEITRGEEILLGRIEGRE
jgi:tetraacyldisaccharide 4'-kinase